MLSWAKNRPSPRRGASAERAAVGNAKGRQPRTRLAKAELEAEDTSKKWELVTKKVQQKSEILAASKVVNVEVKQDLVSTYDTLSALRSKRAQLGLDLTQRRKLVTAVERELETTELEAKEIRAAADAARERRTKLEHLHGALQTANEEADPASQKKLSPRCHGERIHELLRNSHNYEGRYEAALQKQLTEAKDAAAELETEATELQSGAHQEQLEQVSTEYAKMKEQYKETLDALRSTEADVAVLRQQLQAAKERIADASRGFETMKEQRGLMDGAINTQSAGMMSLFCSYRGEAGSMTSRLQQTRQQKMQAELMHTKRLEEIQSASQRWSSPLQKVPLAAWANAGTNGTLSKLSMSSGAHRRSPDDDDDLPPELLKAASASRPPRPQSQLSDRGSEYLRTFFNASPDEITYELLQRSPTPADFNAEYALRCEAINRADSTGSDPRKASLFAPSRCLSGATPPPSMQFRLPELRGGDKAAA